MSEVRQAKPPAHWAEAALATVSAINPPLDRCIVSDEVPVDFIPMRAVEPEGGGLLHPETATYGEVKKGYTSFIAGDVIMAKITPCMENGKTCVVPELPGAACFGSTEFHVLRAECGIQSRWIAYFLLQHSTRYAAQRQMAGGVGQMRVPAAFLNALPLPIPPEREQQRILDTLDELLSDLDAGVAALERVRTKLKHYRAAVLKAAVEGALTVEWHREHPATETADALLTRILGERRRRWEEAQLAKFEAARKAPPKDWKAKYVEPVAPNLGLSAALPLGWRWVTVDQCIISPIVNGISIKGSDSPPGIASLRLSAMTDAGFDYSERRYLPLSPEDVDDLWIQPGDFFVCRGNGSKKLVGRGTLAQEPKEAVIFPDTMMRLRISSIVQAAGWVNSIWQSSVVRNQIEKAAKTTAGIWKISQPDLTGIVLPLPPLQEQMKIVEMMADQLSVIDHLENDMDSRLNSAQALRQSILRHAFTGQLVPQDPTDEPVSELLKRIAVEREERARLARIAKQIKPSTRTARARAKKQ